MMITVIQLPPPIVAGFNARWWVNKSNLIYILVWTGLLLFQTCLIYSLVVGFECCINLVNDKQFKVYWIFEILFFILQQISHGYKWRSAASESIGTDSTSVHFNASPDYPAAAIRSAGSCSSISVNRRRSSSAQSIFSAQPPCRT